MIKITNSRLSLRTALTRVLIMAVLATITVAVFAVTIYETKTYEKRFSAEIDTQLSVIAQNINAAIDFSDRESAVSTLNSLTKDERFLMARVYAADESLFVEVTSPKQVDYSLAQMPTLEVGGTFYDDHYLSIVNVEYQGDILAKLVAYYKMPTLWERMPQYFILSGILLVSLSLLATLLFVSVERFIALPVKMLALKAREIAELEMDDADFLSNNEIVQLEYDFEKMVNSLNAREIRIKEQQARMQLALDAVEQAIVEFDLVNGNVDLDSGMHTLLGMTLTDENIPLSEFLKYFDESSRFMLIDAINAATQNMVLKIIDLYVPAVYGQPRVVQLCCKSVINPYSNKKTIYGVARDVTAKIDAENSLRESDARTKTLLEQSPIAIAIVSETGAFMQINAKFTRLLGYDVTDIPDIHVFYMKSIPDSAYRESIISQFKESFESLSNNGGFKPIDAWLVCKDGSKKAIEFHCARVNHEMILSVVDLTDRKYAENEILQLNVELEDRVNLRTQELEAANRELESFSYSVSHDLRAPLRAINGFGNALQSDYREHLDDDGKLYLDRIMAASQRMSCLIDDLLRFSRLSRTSIEKSTIDMNVMVKEIWRELLESDVGHNTRLAVQDLPPCLADRGLLKQVLFNLINNAVKFSRNNSHPLVEVYAEKDAQQNTVYVIKDNGVGFDMTYAPKLFGVFQRLHRNEEFEGTGVGLALCRRVIERHGGQIWAQSAINQGACFRFTLESSLVE